MDNYIVSARKYRPATFETVVGQASITQTLKNAIRNKQLAQAFLFTGPRGVGKTTCARILAKTINCQNLSPEIEACNECPSCKSFNESASFNIYELDAASNNSVDDIRSLVDQVRIPPQDGDYKVYIIDEVHMLSPGAFNAFLKTLEEPPPYAKFILATTEKHKIIPTILSRCQIYDFKRIYIPDIVSHLKYVAANEGVTYEDAALHIIAQKADGALRDALSIFDQIVSYAGKHLAYQKVIENLNVLDYSYFVKIIDYILDNNIPELLLTVNKIIDSGFDGQYFIMGLGEHLRNLMVCQNEASIKLLEVSKDVESLYLEQSKRCKTSFLLYALNILTDADINYKSAGNKRLHLELMLLKMTRSGYEAGQKKKELDRFEIDLDVPSLVAEASPVLKTPSNNPPSAPVAAKPAVDTSNVPNKPLSQKPEPPKEKPKQQPKVNRVGAIPGGGFNIRTLTTPEIEEKKPEEQLPDKATRFTQDQLEAAWTEMAEHFTEPIRINLTLKKNKPILGNDFKVDFHVDNKMLISDIESKMPEIRRFLFEKLENSKIEINLIEVFTANKKSDKPYTPSEKFEYLAQKNPEILKLHKAFSLKTDY